MRLTLGLGTEDKWNERRLPQCEIVFAGIVLSIAAATKSDLAEMWRLHHSTGPGLDAKRGLIGNVDERRPPGSVSRLKRARVRLRLAGSVVIGYGSMGVHQGRGV